MNLMVQGIAVPAIGLGTWQLRGTQCTEVVELALTIGYRHIDTAQIYANEAAVGKALAAAAVLREDIFLVTKIWPDDFSHRRVIETTNQSLRNLRTDYVDLLLMHWPNSSVSFEETLAAMGELQGEGKVRHIGVSNFSTSQVQEAARHAGIFCNQIKYNPYHQQQDILAQARKMDYLLTAYTPLEKGHVSGDRKMNEIGQVHGKSAAQVTLRWLIQQGMAVIPKASTEGHLKENLDLFEFELSEEEMNAIATLKSGG